MTRGETLRRVFAPESVQWNNYYQAWKEADFGLYFENSLLVAVLQVVGTLFFSLLAAYPASAHGISRTRYYFCWHPRHADDS